MGGHASQGMSRRVFIGRAGALAAGAALGGGSLGTVAAWAKDDAKPGGAVTSYSGLVARDWFRAIYRGVRREGYVPFERGYGPGEHPYFPNGRNENAGNPTGFTPPSAARFYSYVGLAMYEALLPGMPNRRSIVGQLTGRPSMPTARGAGSLDWPAVLSWTLLDLVKPFFGWEESRQRVTQHHDDLIAARRAAGVAEADLARSRAHATSVVTALQRWIAEDGYAQVREADVTSPYVPLGAPWSWQPTSPNFGPAIEPNWSLMRPLVLKDPLEVRPVPHIAFSTSSFHEQAMEVHAAEQAAKRDRERQAIARFWTDNPTQSGLPSGHWMLAVGQVAAQRKLSLAETVEAYAMLGVALADSFLSCWAEKYQSHLLRPVDYIHRYVEHETPAPERWRPITNTPQFPEYTSGHSVSSFASAVVLTHVLGTFPYTDHHDLVDMSPPPAAALPPGGHDATLLPATRRFRSFMHAAEEAAISRLYGGIHYPMGIENGKDQGAELGNLVLRRVRTRK